MKIQVFGTGCSKCAMAFERVRSCVEGLVASGELPPGVEVEKVEDVMAMIRLGIMSTPAVVIDGRVVATGRIPDADEVRAWVSGGTDGETANAAPSCGCGGCGCGR